MARRPDPGVLAHQEWLGFVQPTGLVVSPVALVRAGAILDRRDIEGQRLIDVSTRNGGMPGFEERGARIGDFRAFASAVLGWTFSPKAYAGTEDEPIPPELEVPLPDYGETLRPDFAVRELETTDDSYPWQLLVRVVDLDQDLDAVVRADGRFEASAHSRMERLLRQTGVQAGLLVNGTTLRLISAPRGESSGWLDFRLEEMLQTAGRPISTAFRLLLSETRLLALPRAQRLAALLEDSRKYQNEVSERLAEQVLHALYELLRGFQAAHDQSGGELLREPFNEDPDEVYRGLLTVILRIVFLMYAEERDMLPQDETFLQNYSLGGLYERLRDDAAAYPDTMDRRFGAWAQLLALFRMIYDGAESDSMRLPRRHGVLFDPDRYPFLEGRRTVGGRQVGERIESPLVPDGTIHRALEKLLVLDGERISYRALDVEQIGSVYETMMGFRLERAKGRSVAIKAQKKSGAPTAVNLDALLEIPPGERGRWITERGDRKLRSKVLKAVKAAENATDLHAALSSVIDRYASPDMVPKGAMVLQPSEERRRSGSHYTPRSLTAPIVRTTLGPVLKRLRGDGDRPPTPERILDLKVCDPAMGSGAFLVEACRQLGDAVVESWHYYRMTPTIPPDEDEVVHARRLVAQRCLYGVDRNPVAVDLAKVSLWLVTLAKDHAFTFLDHALRHGDSLVGLSRQQIENFRWEPEASHMQPGFEALRIAEHMARAKDLRRQIREADENVADWELRDIWDRTDAELAAVRLFGDLVVAAFFKGGKKAQREENRNRYANAVATEAVEADGVVLSELKRVDPGLSPFHWEIEYPEVFERDNPGFDIAVGNPPFMGGKKISSNLGASYRDWLATVHKETNNNSDLVAYFFRQQFSRLRIGGALGLIATNTISQGHTRYTGLRWICVKGGLIYAARKRVKWPGQAAVIVSVVHIFKPYKAGAGNYAITGQVSPPRPPYNLDGHEVEKITAYLFHAGGNEDPATIPSQVDLSYHGGIVLGSGFLFEDGAEEATALHVMNEILSQHPDWSHLVRAYIGGAELYTDPRQEPSRYVIDFGDKSEKEARRYGELFSIVEEKVRPQRARLKRKTYRERWWMHGERQPALQAALKQRKRVLVTASRGDKLAFTFQPAERYFAYSLVVFLLDEMEALSVLQSRCHEVWARMFGSTLKDDLAYNPTDCFATFPFPNQWRGSSALKDAGRTYYDFRSSVMVEVGEGLTATYNRFHDPDERDTRIYRLRELHEAMDRAVLDAYGWRDIPTDCEFLLDYEIDEGEWNVRKKKPWRYRWPDNVHDEVLARLLELNAERAAEEGRAGSKQNPGGGTMRHNTPSPSDEGTGGLFS